MNLIPKLYTYIVETWKEKRRKNEGASRSHTTTPAAYSVTSTSRTYILSIYGKFNFAIANKTN